MSRSGFCALVVCVLCALGSQATFAEFYDAFNDGEFAEDPNYFDIDDPNWTIIEKVGLAYLQDANDGELRLYVEGHPFASAGFQGAVVDYGDRDPNTSANWYDESQPHYIVAKMKVNPTEPNEGAAGYSILSDYAQWQAYLADFQMNSSRFELIYVTGLDFSQARGGHNRPDIDKINGFWMVCQFDPGAVPSDPNSHKLKAAIWNGDKYDWNGVWGIDLYITQAWDPNLYPPYSEGSCSIATMCSNYTGTELVSDVKIDNVECRTGIFTNVYRTLDLSVRNDSMGTVTIDPDVLADCNNIDPNEYDPYDYDAQRRYTDGTEIVLVATPQSGKSFKEWLIWDDPNRYPDSNYCAIDSNEVLALTMDTDYVIEGSFKCGGSLPLAAGMTLLALGLGAFLRRLK